MRLAVLVAVAAVAMAACSEKSPPNASGSVGQVQAATTDSVTFVMNEDDLNSPMNNALMTVALPTLRVDPQELATGDPVKVWATVCAQSFPPQCQATSVVVGD